MWWETSSCNLLLTGAYPLKRMYFKTTSSSKKCYLSGGETENYMTMACNSDPLCKMKWSTEPWISHRNNLTIVQHKRIGKKPNIKIKSRKESQSTIPIQLLWTFQPDLKGRWKWCEGQVSTAAWKFNKKWKSMTYEHKITENFQFKWYLSAGLGNLGKNWTWNIIIEEKACRVSDSWINGLIIKTCLRNW